MGITNAGKAAMPDLVGDVNGINAFDYLAVGSSSTTFAATQTALGSEITGNGLARTQVTPTLTTTTVTNDTLQLQKQWTASGSETVKEAGIFNASSAGTMLARKVMDSSHSLTATDTFTWTHQVVFA